MGGAGQLGRYLMPLGRVGTDELPFLGEEMGRVWVRADAIEALARGGHSGGGDGHPFMRAMWERRGGGRLLGHLWGSCGRPRLRLWVGVMTGEVYCCVRHGGFLDRAWARRSADETGEAWGQLVGGEDMVAYGGVLEGAWR